MTPIFRESFSQYVTLKFCSSEVFVLEVLTLGITVRCGSVIFGTRVSCCLIEEAKVDKRRLVELMLAASLVEKGTEV